MAALLALACSDKRGVERRHGPANASREATAMVEQAEQLFANGDAGKALDLLIESLAVSEDEHVRSRAARLLRLRGDLGRSLELSGQGRGLVVLEERVATLAALGRAHEVAQVVSSVELHYRPQLAHAAVDAAENVRALGMADSAGVELLFAVAMAEGSDASDTARFLSRATEIAPNRAELFIALAEVQERRGDKGGAVRAWDRASRLTPGLGRAILVPIRLLAESGRTDEALERAKTVARQARSSKNPDELHLASQAFRYAGEMPQAVTLAREALVASDGEGRLASELAYRLVEANANAEASDVLATLLVCGSRGRPWHRHEIVARLRELLSPEQLTRELAEVPCEAAEPDDLAASLR